MMAIAACGTVLPPYTIYKSSEIFSTWTEGGVVGAGYNRNKSGWMETTIFCDWFQNIVLPYFKKREGKKALIGDNCSSHLSLWVIERCKKENIAFILLPPNTTHLSQPLDVAFFRAIKEHWRDVLDHWKQTNRGALQKDAFPKLLAGVYEKLGLLTPRFPNEKKLVDCKKDDVNQCKGMQNAISGFSSCGIYPINPSKVLSKLERKTPKKKAETPSPECLVMIASLTVYLDNKRKSETEALRTRKRRIQLSPGKGIVPEMLQPQESENEEDIDDVAPIKKVCRRGRPKKVPKKSKKLPASASASVTTSVTQIVSESASEYDISASVSQISASVSQISTSATVTISPRKSSAIRSSDLKPNDFVLSKFLTDKRPRYYVGRIEEVDGSKKISYLRKGSSTFSLPSGERLPVFQFPNILDVQDIDSEYATIEKKVKPHIVLKRNRFTFKFHEDFLKYVD